MWTSRASRSLKVVARRLAVVIAASYAFAVPMISIGASPSNAATCSAACLRVALPTPSASPSSQPSVSASAPTCQRADFLCGHGPSLPPPGVEQGGYNVRFKLTGAYVVSVCLHSDTTIRNNDNSHCTGSKLVGATWNVNVPYTAGDRVLVDFKVQAGPTKNDVDVSGAKSCTLSGTVQAAKLQCDVPIGDKPQSVGPPSIEPFDPLGAAGANGKPAELNILNVLAWCVTAAGVAGLLIVGLQLAMQLRRGIPGFQSELWREILTVAVACFLAITAGPLVAFLNIPLP